MILDDIFEAIDLSNATVQLNPAIVGGTALGAFRNGSIIVWTNDVDIAVNLTAFKKFGPNVRKTLAGLGYVTFYDGLWRVCISSHHPLAFHIYDEDRCKSSKNSYSGDIPYADLYMLKEAPSDSKKVVFVSHGPGPYPQEVILPYVPLFLLDKAYPSVANPDSYFRGIKSYGNYKMEPVINDIH
jgi:hypothetical protein